MSRIIDADRATIVSYNDDDDGEYTAPEQDLLESLKEADDTSEVLLYRQNTKNHKEGMHLIDSWSGDVASLSMIRNSAKEHIPDVFKDTYFRINVRKNGKLVPNGNKCFSISAKTRAAAPDTAPVLTGTTDLARMLEAMLLSQQEDRRAMREIMAPSTRHDPKAEMRELLTLMTMMREATGVSAAPVAPADPFAQLLTTLSGFAKLKQLSGDAGLGAIFGGGGDGGGGEDDSIVSIIKSMAPQAINLFQRSQDLKAAELSARIVNSAPNPAPPDRVTPAVVLTPTAPTLPPDARALLEKLQKAASGDEDTGEWAVFLMGNPATRSFLEPLLSDGHPFKMLASYWPAALDAADWWCDLIRDCQETLTNTSGVMQPSAKSMPDGPSNVSGGASE